MIVKEGEVETPYPAVSSVKSDRLNDSSRAIFGLNGSSDPVFSTTS